MRFVPVRVCGVHGSHDTRSTTMATDDDGRSPVSDTTHLQVLREPTAADGAPATEPIGAGGSGSSRGDPHSSGRPRTTSAGAGAGAGAGAVRRPCDVPRSSLRAGGATMCSGDAETMPGPGNARPRLATADDESGTADGADEQGGGTAGAGTTARSDGAVAGSGSSEPSGGGEQSDGARQRATAVTPAPQPVPAPQPPEPGTRTAAAVPPAPAVYPSKGAVAVAGVTTTLRTLLVNNTITVEGPGAEPAATTVSIDADPATVEVTELCDRISARAEEVIFDVIGVMTAGSDDSDVKYLVDVLLRCLDRLSAGDASSLDVVARRVLEDPRPDLAQMTYAPHAACLCEYAAWHTDVVSALCSCASTAWRSCQPRAASFWTS